MDEKLVSIIIPAYNAEKYIEETIKSALASQYPNFEIVVVNDGSVDSTQEIIENLASQYPSIRVFKQANSGVSAARNHAIREAKGTFIMPLDSDDIICENYLSEAVKIFEQQPDVKVVGCEAEFIGNKTGRWVFKPFSINLLCRKNLIPCTAMYRKEEWERVGGYCEEQQGREDWDFWLSILRNENEFFRLPIVGFYYRIHENSKRVADRSLKNATTDILNIRHKPLLFRELKGRLHYQRTHSKTINYLINLFKPFNVHINTQNPVHEKYVYASNESQKVRDLIAVPREEINYICYTEKRFHLPGSRIKNSKARGVFRKENRTHLGYYEEQVSLTMLKSYLAVHKPETIKIGSGIAI